MYHCWCVDPAHPARPTLEVDALLRPGDADAESGPLLLSIADYIPMAGGLEVAGPCLERAGRQGADRRAPRRAPHHVPDVERGGARSWLNPPLRSPARSRVTQR